MAATSMRGSLLYPSATHRQRDRLQNAHEAVRDINLAALDLALLKFELEQLGGDKLQAITDRLQKNLDTISAARSQAASEKGIVAKGALAFMDVCGPPPT
jgi:hypothetical protein